MGFCLEAFQHFLLRLQVGVCWHFVFRLSGRALLLLASVTVDKAKQQHCFLLSPSLSLNSAGSVVGVCVCGGVCLHFHFRKLVSLTGSKCLWGWWRRRWPGFLDCAVQWFLLGAGGCRALQARGHRGVPVHHGGAVRAPHPRPAGGSWHACCQPPQLLESHGGSLHQTQSGPCKTRWALSWHGIQNALCDSSVWRC